MVRSWEEEVEADRGEKRLPEKKHQWFSVEPLKTAWLNLLQIIAVFPPS